MSYPQFFISPFCLSFSFCDSFNLTSCFYFLYISFYLSISFSPPNSVHLCLPKPLNFFNKYVAYALVVWRVKFGQNSCPFRGFQRVNNDRHKQNITSNITQTFSSLISGEMTSYSLPHPSLLHMSNYCKLH